MVQRSSIPAEPCRTPFVEFRSRGRAGPSQFGSSQADPRSKKPAASVRPPRGMRYSVLAPVVRFAPAGAAEEAGIERHVAAIAASTDELHSKGPGMACRENRVMQDAAVFGGRTNHVF